MKNRARNDIIAMILKAAQGRGTSKTKIMFTGVFVNQSIEGISGRIA